MVGLLGTRVPQWKGSVSCRVQVLERFLLLGRDEEPSGEVVVRNGLSPLQMPYRSNRNGPWRTVPSWPRTEGRAGAAVALAQERGDARRRRPEAAL